ncbi:2,3-bisphosphoglycerate-independent phosphoglycerate mutase [Inquilinus limosus]|uniref:2,3-bisphosphoglycerate-independent phosphoglycerate mutase n=1 Tax=Inquilinus limosus TaxID=171674 RepID=UPI003F184112
MSAAATTPPRPVVLCVLDGWGWREDEADNAVRQARTPNFDRLWAEEPHAFLEASGEAVGLPAGQIGNSEVGHMNLGAGRVVFQDLQMIFNAIADGSLAKAEALRKHIAAMRASGGTCHLMGLLSPGGVHAHQDHMVALAKIVAGAGVPVAIHAFTDGRDTPPQAGADYLRRFIEDIEGLPATRVATVDGRYYAMDRDKRWERVEKAYRAVAEARGETAPDAVAAVEAAYKAETGDEFILPTVIGGYAGMKDGDGVLCANFRADRVREILQALLDPAFDGFARSPIRFADACGMVEYSDLLNGLMAAIFPPKSIDKGLGEVVAEAGRTQLRTAETEKYPHVTFFFNGGEERQFPGEDRILVPSPKVATYDLQPEMSAPEVCEKLVAAIDSGKYDLVVVNFANPDMVGHTGVLEAAIKACETVDTCLGKVEAAVRRQGGAMIVTADHGNAELMRDPETGGPHTAHTLNKVPAILVNAPKSDAGGPRPALHDGRLADVAPTLLALMGLPQPAQMTGRSLIGAPEAAPM